LMWCQERVMVIARIRITIKIKPSVSIA
jgi:hypothetical protein